MKKIILIICALTCSFFAALAEESTSNVVIERLTDIYKLVPAKDGDGLEKWSTHPKSPSGPTGRQISGWQWPTTTTI